MHARSRKGKHAGIWQSIYHYDKGARRPRQHYQHKFYTYLFPSRAHSRAELTWGRLEFSETARNLCPGTLNSEQAKFTDDLIRSVCVCWLSPALTECVGQSPAMPSELTTPRWRSTAASNQALMHTTAAADVWVPLHWTRDTDLLVNYESKHWPSYFLRDVSADIIEPDKQHPFLFDCLVWDNEAAQTETPWIKHTVLITEYAKVACNMTDSSERQEA